MQDRRRQEIESCRDPLVLAVGGIKILHEIVRAYRKKIDPPADLVELPQHRRHLDHDAKLEIGGWRPAVLPQMGKLILDKSFRGFEFLQRCDHRKHNAHFTSRAGTQQAAQLRTQKAWPVKTDADGAPSKRRVVLLDSRHVRQNLVGADVEGAEGNLLAINKFEGGPVKSLLLAHPWPSRCQHELNLGPEKSDRHRARLCDVLEIDQHSCVHMQINGDAVLGHGRHVAQFAILLLLARAQPRLFGIGMFDVRRRPQMNIAGDAIDDHGIAGLNQIDNIGYDADGRDAERPGNDRDMA